MSSLPDRSAKQRDAGAKSADAFRTISEVAEILGVQQHVLRFWETRFNQIKPMKRGGGRRYYRPEDVALLRGISKLLYEEGYTIKGVQKLLREKGVKAIAQVEAPSVVVDNEPMDLVDQAEAATGMPAATKAELEDVLDELKTIRASFDD